MKITKAKLKDIIKEELSAFSEEDNTTPIEEGFENFTPENLRMVIDSLIQMGIPAGGVVAAAMALTNFFEGKPGDLSAKADLYAAAEEEAADRS